ncbi:MAG: hypothetical protein AAF921_12385 [Cyanobacteria bacterium P01_D01_bin.44]
MKSLSFERSFATIATLAVLSGIVAGFWVLGSPGRQRLIASDQRRANDLQETARTLYWQAQDKGEDYRLPDTLSTRELGKDPITQQPYEYNRLSDSTYELCAVFETDSSTYPLRNRPSEEAEKWNHPEGQHCFEFDISEQPPSFY